MSVNPGMLAVFCVVSGIFGGLRILAGSRYNHYLEPLDEKTWRMKPVIPVGLFILEKSGYRFNTAYDRRLLSWLSELYGTEYAFYYLHIHWANAAAYSFTALLALSLLGLGTGPDAGFALFCAMVLAGIAYFSHHELHEKVKKRRQAIQMDFPGFLNKLTLLVNTGMTVYRAWKKIVTDNRKEGPLYSEAGAVLLDIQSGKSEMQAYEGFAKRCRIPEVTKFVSIVLQNLKKGNSELVPILSLQAGECWEMRKNAARRLGEEASTKMILPMIIMFIAILVIVAVPAILSLQGI